VLVHLSLLKALLKMSIYTYVIFYFLLTKWHKSTAPDTGVTGEEGARGTYIFYLTVMEE